MTRSLAELRKILPHVPEDGYAAIRDAHLLFTLSPEEQRLICDDDMRLLKQAVDRTFPKRVTN